MPRISPRTNEPYAKRGEVKQMALAMRVGETIDVEPQGSAGCDCSLRMAMYRLGIRFTSQRTTDGYIRVKKLSEARDDKSRV